jgi:hypothetical protein
MASPSKGTSSSSVGQTLCEGKAVVEACKKRRTHKVAQSLESTVAKALADNLKGWAWWSTHGHDIEGLTIHARLLQDLQKKKENPNSIVLGALYYKALQTKYGDGNTLYDEFKPTSPKERLDDNLVKAVAAHRASNSNKVPLIEWMAVSSAPPQRELCGILRCAMLLRPSASAGQLQLLLEIMKWLVLHKCHAVFPREVGVLRTVWMRLSVVHGPM